MNKKILLFVLGALALLTACHRHNDATPKPQAYLRIDMPAQSYTLYDTLALPFTFERSDLAQVEWKKNPDRAADRWFTLHYPAQKGYVFLSYKSIRGPQDLRAQIDTTYRFVQDNFGYSSGVDENQFVNRGQHLYGTTYHLKGQNVASTYQFYVTDSVRHFLRGALYIDCTPNNDSLAPVLEYIRGDINHFIESIRWR